ncbi:MAG TPA: N-sulfoglucosamine sulfohydrolase, partial [Microlunatus sp.]
HNPTVELYDLADDPLELVNRADDPELADVRADLLERLSDWMTTTEDPLLAGAVTSPSHRAAVQQVGDAVGS